MCRPGSVSTMSWEVADMTAPTFTSPHITHTPPARVCTIRNRTLARVVFAALLAIAVLGAGWLTSVMTSGPYLADSLVVEGLVAGIVLFAGIMLAASLNRALGCGHCHTPDCTCW
jgi:hypothetical protein